MMKAMTVVLGKRRRRLLAGRRTPWLAAMGAVMLVLALAVYAYDCWQEIQAYQRPPASWASADAVVVLGAAVWPGGVASPALRERTKEATRLFLAGSVRYFITTGGVGITPPSEASVASELAITLGIPPQAQLREEQSTNTWESAVGVSKLARDQGIDKVIVVSDGFHLARARRMFQENGLDVQVAPVPQSARVFSPSVWRTFEYRETAALMLYRLGLRW